MKLLCNWKYISLSIFAINLFTMCYIWMRLDGDSCNCQDKFNFLPNSALIDSETVMTNNSDINDTQLQSEDAKQLNQLVTIVIREFELFENDIIDSIKSILKIDEELKILIISDKIPYPPLHLQLAKEFPNNRISVIALHSYPYQSTNESLPEYFIHTEYILIVPDSIRIQSFEIHQMINEHILYPDDLIASYTNDKNVKCLSLKINLLKWTLQYNTISIKNRCNIIDGNHVLLIPTKLLLKLNHPFSRPFPHALYLQTVYKNIKVHIVPNLMFKQKKLFIDAHNRWKHDMLTMQRITNLYQQWGIKKIVHENGKIDWYGCTKTTARCFGTVIGDMPEYLYEGRWTPPCCLEHLRETARHVFKILEKCEVRYWLEGGSLLGAARNGDIIPWDYDIDIGIYKEDIKKCEWLKNAEQQSIIDNKGYVWEKAKEGDFIRVQFSQSNHLHVDIFPFYSVKGIMTKHTWFATHKQDMEFPEHYLKPLTKIKFIGIFASAPNAIREFLEMKFGKNVIETSQYPNPQMLKFPDNY